MAIINKIYSIIYNLISTFVIKTITTYIHLQTIFRKQIIKSDYLA